MHTAVYLVALIVNNQPSATDDIRLKPVSATGYISFNRAPPTHGNVSAFTEPDLTHVS